MLDIININISVALLIVSCLLLVLAALADDEL